MKEYITEAFVLGVRPRGGDRVADLFTLGMGRLDARMVAGRAITSKFSPHCDPLNLLTVRLVKKKRYTLADAITADRFPALRGNARAFQAALEALLALRILVAREEPDPRLFHELRRVLAEGKCTVRSILALLGYDPRAAHCARCKRSSVNIFVPSEGIFFCRACFTVPGDEVVLFI